MPKWRASSWRAFEPAAAAPRSAAASWRVLGLDPGSRRTGFGVIECHGVRTVHLAHGCVSCAEESLAARLRLIFEAVGRVITEHHPDEIAVERVFVNRNVDSALKLGQARGAALCAIPQGTPVFEYAPRAIKLAVVGFGAADKHQVAHMIGALLGVTSALPHDATDALAVALCHAHSRRVPLPGQTTTRAALHPTEESSG